MNEITESNIQVGRHQLRMRFRHGIAPATEYSLLLAKNIPPVPQQTVVDLGTGSGLLAIVARLQGARTVYLLDTYDKAIGLALENAALNGVADGLVPLATGTSMLPLPSGERVDLILSNPAQLPLPEKEAEHSPFYAGPEGRDMIDAIIAEAHLRLKLSGQLLMTHNSLANLDKTFALMRAAGLTSRIIQEIALPFRPFIDRAWLDSLGGEREGLYFRKDGVPHERLCIIEAVPSKGS